MPYTSTLDTAAARAAISKGDDLALERYLREGGNNPVQNITAATGNLIPGTNLINKATGSNVYLLPAATGSQNIVRVVIGTTITSGSAIIKTATNADFFVGMMTFATTTFAAGSTEALGGTDALHHAGRGIRRRQGNGDHLYRHRRQPVAGSGRACLDHGGDRGRCLGLIKYPGGLIPARYFPTPNEDDPDGQEGRTEIIPETP